MNDARERSFVDLCLHECLGLNIAGLLVDSESIRFFFTGFLGAAADKKSSPNFLSSRN